MNYALLLTLLVGLFILVGALIVFKTKGNKKVLEFSLGIALGVMASLAILDLIPECYDYFINDFKLLKTIILIVAAAMIGMGLLKILDHFVPSHHEENKKKEDNHLKHIGMVSAVALILHNIIEGMALYSLAHLDIKMGLFMCLGIGLHNIPVGMMITSTLYTHKQDKKRTIMILTLASLSTFLGGILIFLCADVIGSNLLGILLGITLGMLLYIILFELIPQIKHMKHKKMAGVGIISGTILFLISLFF